MEQNKPMGIRFSILHRSFRLRIDELLRQRDITGVQFGVMDALLHFEKQGINVRQRELENSFHVTHPTMTEIIKRLEKKQLIVCVQNEADRRSKFISLSDEGRALMADISEIDREVFDELCEGLSAEQKEQLTEITEIMLKNIKCCGKGCDKLDKNKGNS